MKKTTKEILNKLSYLNIEHNDKDDVYFSILAVDEYGDLNGLKKYVKENPKVSAKALVQYIELYLLPVIFIAEEDETDFTEEYAFETRIKAKLSRFIHNLGSEYDVWSGCIRPCMQFRVTRKMEQYIDEHPSASLQELKEQCSCISGEASKAIRDEYS